MTRRNEQSALAQMLDFAQRLLRITSGRSRRDLEEDELLQLAVERMLEKLGEASRRVPDEVRSAHGDIPWQRIAGMRNRLIHVYDDIDYEIIWDTVQTDLPTLIEYLKRILR